MEELNLSGPLTARKCAIARSRSTSSSLSFPRVPRRSSSLSMSISNDSSGPTSTRTPSLSDSLYNIEVAKLRQPHTYDRRDENLNPDSSNDPFLEKTPRAMEHKQNQYQEGSVVTPRLVVRWGSGSWKLPDSPLRTKSIDHFVNEDPPRSRPTPSIRRYLNSLCPMDLPISFISVDASTKRLQIGMHPETLSATIQVAADIDSAHLHASSGVAPLDVIILLDTMIQPSVNLLTQITLGSSVVASHLVYNHDRIALAFKDQREQSGFKLLLPLGHHSTEATRSALNRFAQQQLFSDRETAPDLGTVIENLCGVFSKAPRNAYCHLFLISATPPMRLSIHWTDQGIGFHTITPRTSMSLDPTTSKLGWHISYGLGTSDASYKETHFIRKVSKVLRQLRTGVRPGAIANLSLSIVPRDGCKVPAFYNHLTLNCLRPGEVWTIPIQVHVPAAELYLHSDRHNIASQHPMIDEMLTQINFLLQEYSAMDVSQPILAAHVEYQHSLFTKLSTIHVETHLNVLRQGEV